MSTEEIIEAVGGMGRFQVLAIVVILAPRLVVAWGMLMMSFAGVPPTTWWCEVEDDISTHNNWTESRNIKMCPENSSCTFRYSSEKYTVVNEWDLVCEFSNINPLLIAVQMGGVFLGCILAGQSADMIGRKKTYVLSFVLHAGFNLVAAFSSSWQMFAVLRFFIGSMVGSVLTVSFPYFMEFVGKAWRPVTAVVPFWQIGTGLLALSAWLRPNWIHLHIILTAMHVPCLVGFLVMPESLRWLAVHGRLKEAEAVVDQMARYNRREKPANTTAILKKIADDEHKTIDSAHKYTYLDIYRTWSVLWKSVVMQFVWMCLSFVFYGISFGVGKLHGNLFLNMFLVSFIGIPGIIIVYFLHNSIGRRWTSFLFFVLATAGAFGVVTVSRLLTSTGGRGPATTGLALMCRLGVASAWNSYAVITSENYPTTIRNLGYGAANSAARVGSIVSPYIFAMGGDDLLPPFVIVGSLMGLCALSCLLLSETKDVPLPDSSTAKAEGKSEYVLPDTEKRNSAGVKPELQTKL